VLARLAVRYVRSPYALYIASSFRLTPSSTSTSIVMFCSSAHIFLEALNLVMVTMVFTQPLGTEEQNITMEVDVELGST